MPAPLPTPVLRLGARSPGRGRVAARLRPAACGVALLAALAAGAASPAAPPAPAAPDEIGGYATDHVLVKLRPGIRTGVDAAGRPCFVAADGPAAESAALLAGVGALGAHSASPITPARAALAASIGMDRWVIVRVAPGSDTPAIAAALARLTHLVELAEADGIGGLAEVVPDDPSFPEQYNLRNTGQVVGGVPGVPGADVSATDAWGITTGGQAVVVATLDSGVTPVADLEGRVLPGWNIPLQNASTNDVCNGHGTHVAGIIAASGNDATTVAGLCWDARILPVVVVNPCSGLESYAADGLVWATDQGATIVNMSLQYSAGTQYFKDAVIYAAASGVVMLAATGNSGITPPSFPSRWPQTIAVAATDNTDHRWPNSNYGPQVDVAAPGVSVLSLSPSGGVATKTGTSMAAPHVSGTVALLRGMNPTLSPDQIRTLLTMSADDVESPGPDDYTGAGRLNAFAAILAAQAFEPPADLNHDGVVDAADLGLLLAGWGACGACDACPADVNGDCQVDGLDLSLLLAWWTTS
ncbi:MAG: S8 family serine peptidase [Phycisphaerales bacterium]